MKWVQVTEPLYNLDNAGRPRGVQHVTVNINVALSRCSQDQCNKVVIFIRATSRSNTASIHHMWLLTICEVDAGCSYCWGCAGNVDAGTLIDWPWSPPTSGPWVRTMRKTLILESGWEGRCGDFWGHAVRGAVDVGCWVELSKESLSERKGSQCGSAREHIVRCLLMH